MTGLLERQLSAAIDKGDITTIKLLIKTGATIDAADDVRGMTHLHRAVLKGDIKAVRVLIENGATVDAQDLRNNTPLQFAAAGGHTEIVKLLIEHKASINTHNIDGSTPLHSASWAGIYHHIQITGILLEQGAKVNARTVFHKDTPLHHAAAFGCTTRVNLLIEKGADIHAVNHEGFTPAHSAAKSGQIPIVQAFLDMGVDGTGKNHSGVTLLHAAAKGGCTWIIPWLIEKGMDVNAQDSEHGNTPLQCSVNRGQEKTIAMLIDMGARTDIRNKIGHTPLHRATILEHMPLIEALLSGGAKITDETGFAQWTPEVHRAIILCLRSSGRSAELAEFYSKNRGALTKEQQDVLDDNFSPVAWERSQTISRRFPSARRRA